jgi:LuxR family maltose regulon positive regulatory protein
LPEGDLVARGYITSLLGTVLRWGGDLATATQTTAEAIAISQAAGDIHVAIDALSDLALSQTFQGRLHEAAATCRDALQLANEYVRKGGRQPPIAGLAHARLSAVLRIWNDLEAAIRHAREGVELCKQWGQVDTLIACYVNLARALQANGDTEDALNVMQQAKQIAGNLSSLFVTYTETHEARMRLAQGDVAAATRWAAAWENRLDADDDERNFQYEFNNLTLARVFIVQGERQPGGSLDKALQLLRRLLQATEAAGRMARVIEILVLQALALQAKGEGDQALTALERALFLAEPEGYVRVFIDEGAPIGRLLRQAVARGIAVDYANELLAALEKEKDERQTTELPPSPLAEPLSERELEVLRLLTTSLSTPEIAEELCITASTVRSHVKRIYRKLNVHRRMDAVLQAKELRLL